MPVEIRLTDKNGMPVRAIARIIYGEPETLQADDAESDADGKLYFAAVTAWSELRVVFYGGYWTLLLDAKDFSGQQVCPELPSCRGRMWWHEILGLDAPDPSAGENITIGVVDMAFARTVGLEHVTVHTLGGNPYAGEIGTMPAHGEAVCRLIGERMDDPTRFGGVAPGARLICINAEHDATLNPAVTSAAIVKLAREYHCDLINLSGGRQSPAEGLREAISEAREYGALCIVAAGNEPHPQVSYPARYGECIAVGAIGLRDWGPPPSLVRVLSDVASSRADMVGGIGGFDVFHSPKSAYGEGLDVVGPGVGLIIHRGPEPIYDAIGTSFSAPLVAGLLAVILGKTEAYRRLPRLRERAAFAERTLRGVCQRTGIGLQREGAGLPRFRGDSARQLGG